MEKHETTEKKARKPEQIEWTELNDLLKKANEGDEIATEEVKAISESLVNSGLLSKTVEFFVNEYNDSHKTTFSTFEEVQEDYRKHNAQTTKPRKYVRPVGLLVDSIFNNKIGKEAQKATKVTLNTEDKSKYIGAYIKTSNLINTFDEMKTNLEKIGVKMELPEFSLDDRIVINGILSNLVAGNKTMTRKMIYRAFTGDLDNDHPLTDEFRTMIDKGLLMFESRTRIITPPNFTNIEGDEISFDEEGAFLHFDRINEATVNGTGVKDAIYVYDYPIFYKFLLLNGGREHAEIDSQDIKFFNIPKMRKNPDSVRLVYVLYSHIMMRKTNKKLNKKILLDTIWSDMGKTLDKANPRDRKEKSDLLKLVIKILEYWKAEEIITDYTFENKKGSREKESIQISFDKKKKIIKKNSPKIAPP